MTCECEERWGNFAARSGRSIAQVMAGQINARSREIERLQSDLDYLIGVLEGIRDTNNPESAPYKAIGALVALSLRAGTEVDADDAHDTETPD